MYCHGFDKLDAFLSVLFKFFENMTSMSMLRRSPAGSRTFGARISIFESMPSVYDVFV